MNENMRKWIDALRSGNYEQAQGRLKRDDEFCCLGVACDVSGLGEWRTYPGGLPYYALRDAGGTAETELPKQVAEWLGLPTPDADGDPEYDYIPNPLVQLAPGELEGRNFSEIEVISLNDDFGYDFNQIADALERTYG